MDEEKSPTTSSSSLLLGTLHSVATSRTKNVDYQDHGVDVLEFPGKILIVFEVSNWQFSNFEQKVFDTSLLTSSTAISTQVFLLRRTLYGEPMHGAGHYCTFAVSLLNFALIMRYHIVVFGT